MYCQDLDLSKSGEISQLSEDFSEIKFSITKIFIQNNRFLQRLVGSSNLHSKSPKSQTIGLKLKFYSAFSSCKLKQKLTRVSILQNLSMPKDSCILELQKDAINLKVSFPTQEEYQIYGKVYIEYKTKQKKLPQDKNLYKLFGTFRINLLEWKKTMMKERGQNQNQNPQSSINLKRVELNFQYMQISGFNPSQNIASYINKQTFIQFKIFQPQNVQKIFNNFHFDNGNNLVLRRKQLKIMSCVVSQKIKGSFVFRSVLTQPRFDILPEKQILYNLSRAKSEAFFQAISPQKHEENILGSVAEKTIKDPSKSFNQQIYQLLQEVKVLKQGIKIQRNKLEIKKTVSRIKNVYCMMSPQNVYCMMSPQKVNQNYLTVIPQNFHYSNRNPQVQQIMPLSSVLKKSFSDDKFSVNEDQFQNSLQKSVKQQKVLRIQKRLESFQKIRRLSNLNKELKLAQRSEKKQIQKINFVTSKSIETSNEN